MSHFTFTLLFAALVSGAEALPRPGTARDRLHRAGYIFACSVATVLAAGWIMFLIHR